MSGILAGIFLVCVIAVLAFAGVAATTIAVIAVICVVLAAIIALVLGTAVVLFELMIAVLLALFLQFIFCRVLTYIGERANVPALLDRPFVSRVAWILSGITTGYLYFIR